MERCAESGFGGSRCCRCVTWGRAHRGGDSTGTHLRVDVLKADSARGQRVPPAGSGMDGWMGRARCEDDFFTCGGVWKCGCVRRVSKSCPLTTGYLPALLSRLLPHPLPSLPLVRFCALSPPRDPQFCPRRTRIARPLTCSAVIVCGAALMLLQVVRSINSARPPFPWISARNVGCLFRCA